jgi:Cu-Zn family superoxide dismutase
MLYLPQIKYLDITIITVMSIISAIAVFQGKKIKGVVHFRENPEKNNVEISLDIQGLGKNKLHGFHIHTYGDMSEGCNSMCSHYNPYGKNHGGPNSTERHVGDLGNIHTDANGYAKYVFYDNHVKLHGTKCNIIGRGLIIHADEDDLGLGKEKDSLTTGHAGERIACAVIGYSKSK